MIEPLSQLLQSIIKVIIHFRILCLLVHLIQILLTKIVDFFNYETLGNITAK